MKIPRLLGAAVLIVSVSFGVARGQGHDGPTTVEVRCGKGETIQEALDRHADHGRSLVVIVSGVCKEHVTIDRDDVSLVGGPAGATVDGPDPGRNTLTIVGHRALVDGLTVRGGRTGVVIAGARVTILNCTTESTGRNGITFFQGASGTLDNCRVQKSAASGIVVESGSATITRSTVVANGDSGILVFNNGSARIGIDSLGALAGNDIRDNGTAGVQVTLGGSAALGGNTITGNGTGVGVVQGRATLVGANVVEHNVGAGVVASAATILIGDPGFGLPTSNRIRSNGTAGLPPSIPIGGVFAFLGAQVDIRGAEITDNVGHGVRLLTRSTARFDNSTVTGNTGDGIRLTFGSAVHVSGAAVTATPNVGIGLRCDDAESSFFGVIVGAVVCTGY